MEKKIKKEKKILTPKAFADYYLTNTIRMPLLLKDLYNYSRDESKAEFYPFLNQIKKEDAESYIFPFILSMKIKIGPHYWYMVKQNYSNDVMDRILLCLADFKILLEIEAEGKAQKSNLFMMRKNYIDSIKIFLSGTNQILNTSILKKEERNIQLLLKQRLEKEIKPLTVDWLDDILFSFIPSVDDYMGNKDNRDEHKKTIASMNITRRAGRPYELKYALMIIIYKLLILSPPKLVQPYKEWCKQLTADIINIVFGLTITNKDVDNALSKP